MTDKLSAEERLIVDLLNHCTGLIVRENITEFAEYKRWGDAPLALLRRFKADAEREAKAEAWREWGKWMRHHPNCVSHVRVECTCGLDDECCRWEQGQGGDNDNLTPHTTITLALLAAGLHDLNLPIREEREFLVNLGVYPKGVTSLYRLRQIITTEFQRSTVEEVAERFKPNESPEVLAALRNAADAYGGEPDDATD